MNMARVGGLSHLIPADHEGGGFIWNFIMDSIQHAGLGTIF
jgi:hypothetical protein